MNVELDDQIRLREIFCVARNVLQADDQAKLLDERCGNDEVLRQQVERLLAAVSDQKKSPLDRADEMLSPAELLNAFPECQAFHIDIENHPMIGPYKLLEQIGEGGMGVVYAAVQQQPIRRMVALKLIKPGMDSKQVIRRFEAEKQTLAMMNHPHIAKVLDAGATDSGIPYFVMELVKGLPITKFCDNHKLDLRARLELFLTVCGAVQHAHQKGIIHRDLKPSNILVELEGVLEIPKVIDFGVAKAMQQPLLEDGVYTGMSQMIGTPLYMSPEQTELNSLDVDTRSDVYSLGVLLYELLTGSTPFDREMLKQAGFDEMRRIIREDDPVRPSSRISTLQNHIASTVSDHRWIEPRDLCQSLKRELDWIVMRALEKDRSRRYESASALADDVKRYLNGESVQACPPSSWYRLSKLVQRHRVALATSSFVALALIIGLSASIWQAVRATKAEQRSEEHNQLARRAVDDMYSQVAENWLADQGMLNEVQHEFLQKALAYYSETTNEKGSDPQAIWEPLRARQRVAALQSKLGQHADAEASYRKLIDECDKLLGSSPKSHPIRLLLVAAKAGLANMLRPMGREAETVELASGTYADVCKLDAFRFGKQEEQKLLASSLHMLGTELIQAGKHSAADDTVQRCFVVRESLLKTNPESWDFRLGVAKAHSLVGMQRMWWGGKNADAEKAYLEAEKRFSALLSERLSDRQCRQSIQTTLGNLGVICSWEKRFLDATEYHRRSVAIAETLSREFPQDHKMLESHLLAVGNLASSLVDQSIQNNLQEVLVLRHQELALAASLLDIQPEVGLYWVRYFQTASLVARTHLLHGEPKTADQVLQDALHRMAACPILDPATFSTPDISRIWAIAAHEATELLILRAGRLADTGDHREIANTLQALTPRMCYFDSDWVTQEKKNSESIQGRDIALRNAANDCRIQHESLTKLAELYFACARFADGGSSVQNEQDSQLIESYRLKADVYRKESERALEAWAQNALDVVRLSRSRWPDIFTNCESMCKQADKDLRAFSQFHHRLNRQCVLERCRQFIQLVMKEYPDDRKLTFLVGYLVAGPEELINSELAVRIAQAAIERSKDGQTTQYLGWAMFRAGHWDKCLEILVPPTGQKEKGEIDLDNSAVIAMALWQLGRKEEAVSWLGAEYERQLDDYITKCDDTSHVKTWFPSSSMLIRLDKEAKSMLQL